MICSIVDFMNSYSGSIEEICCKCRCKILGCLLRQICAVATHLHLYLRGYRIIYYGDYIILYTLDIFGSTYVNRGIETPWRANRSILFWGLLF